jgi:hypothetical protein
MQVQHHVLTAQEDVCDAKTTKTALDATLIGTSPRLLEKGFLLARHA